ncbi:MAG TPA: hypothetical protein PKE12_12815 [Kiritimatiellia bacterium]|nr:hypothetical protein [Kiritimatiellia bacterium]
MRSGLLWTILAVAGIEFALSRTLPDHYFRHEVDELLREVDTRRFTARNLSLGNSVGRQLDRGIDKLEPGFLEPMSSNGSLETTGQYLILRRYLERNPQPRNLILWMDNPFAGSLHLIYTENYIQRCFLRWREIGLLAWWKGSPTFAANMVAYKLLPSYRYRMELQEELPFLEVMKVMGDLQNAARARTGLGVRESVWTRHWQDYTRDGQSISSVALERMLALCQARGIHVYLIPTPMREREATRRDRRGGRTEINQRLAALADRYDVLHYLPDQPVFPNDMFPDTAHFAPHLVPIRAREYLDLLKEWMTDDAG